MSPAGYRRTTLLAALPKYLNVIIETFINNLLYFPTEVFTSTFAFQKLIGGAYMKNVLWEEEKNMYKHTENLTKIFDYYLGVIWLNLTWGVRDNIESGALSVQMWLIT